MSLDLLYQEGLAHPEVTDLYRHHHIQFITIKCCVTDQTVGGGIELTFHH